MFPAAHVRAGTVSTANPATPQSKTGHCKTGHFKTTQPIAGHRMTGSEEPKKSLR